MLPYRSGLGQLSLPILLWVGAMTTLPAKHKHRHTTQSKIWLQRAIH